MSHIVHIAVNLLRLQLLCTFSSICVYVQGFSFACLLLYTQRTLSISEAKRVCKILTADNSKNTNDDKKQYWLISYYLPTKYIYLKLMFILQFRFEWVMRCHKKHHDWQLQRTCDLILTVCGRQVIIMVTQPDHYYTDTKWCQQSLFNFLEHFQNMRANGSCELMTFLQHLFC